MILTELADDVAYCVTNLRREEKLAETRAFLDNILQSSTKYSIIGEDLDRKILFWNEGARRNYGYTADEIVGKSQDILHTPEDRASGAVDQLVEIANDKGIAEGEFERVRKDGTRFPAQVVVTRRDDASGNPIGYLIISSDISEKRQAEEQLRAASQYARSLIEASLDPLMTISPDGKITDVNHADRVDHGAAARSPDRKRFCGLFYRAGQGTRRLQAGVHQGLRDRLSARLSPRVRHGDGSALQCQPVSRRKRSGGRRVCRCP